jgi:hypothetical protein
VPRNPTGKRRGPRGKYSHKVIDKIVESLELGIPLKWAVRSGGITLETWSQWQLKHPELVDRAEEATAKFVQAHMANIKCHARDNWQASAWCLERTQAGEFARPETKVMIANINGAARADDPTTTWMEIANAAVTQPLPAGEGEGLTLEMPLPDPVKLAKPVQALPPPGPEVVDQSVEPEPTYDPHANSKMYLPDKDLTPLERQMRYGFDQSQVPPQSRGLTVAAKPSPPPAPGYNEWGDKEMISGWGY